jgi:hypothetical protein
VTDLIFPLGNKREYEDVPEDLKQGMAPHFVDSYEQVFELAFPDGIKQQQQQQQGAGSSNQQQQESAGAPAGAAAAAAGWSSLWQ